MTAIAAVEQRAWRVLEFDALRCVVAEFAATEPGRRAARTLQPIRDRDALTHLHRETTELRTLHDAGLAPPFAGVEDIAAMVETLDQCRVPLEPDQLLMIGATLRAIADLRAFAEAQREIAPTVCSRMLRCATFTREQAELERCIDRDKTVATHASPALNDARRRIRAIRARIAERLRRMIDDPNLQRALESTTITERNGRPVLALKSNSRGAIVGTLWDRSNSGATLFVEPHAVSGLVNELEDARYAETREVERILWELTRMLAARQSELDAALATLAAFDLACARARFSAAFAMHPPVLADDAVLTLHDARHPLLLYYVWHSLPNGPERLTAALAAVVPIAFHLGDDFDAVVVTGPNTGGKTVTLKTIGLLTLMAQCGLHVPAGPGSRVPVHRSVFADIGDEQSLQQSLSTFSAHLTAIGDILRAAAPGDLVLLDEIGAGTDPDEGAALATALLDFLRERRVQVVATTHLGTLKAYASTTARVENASVEFDVQTLRPTFRLLMGQPGSSNALAVAQHLRIPPPVVAAARAMLDRGATHTAELINRVQRIRTDAEERRARAETQLRVAEERVAEAAAAHARAQSEAQAVVDCTMRDLRVLADEYQRAAAGAPDPWAACAREFCRRLATLADGTPLATLHAQFIDQLNAGDRVFVQSLQSYGIVKAVRRKRGVVRVNVNNIDVDVPFAAIVERPFVRDDPRVKPPVKPAAAPPQPDVAVEEDDETAEPVPAHFCEKLAAGAAVYVPLFHSAAHVVRVDRRRRRVIVESDGVEASVPFANVRPARRRRTAAKTPSEN
jgi:DNA mismatch repair protein MutS2